LGQVLQNQPLAFFFADHLRRRRGIHRRSLFCVGLLRPPKQPGWRRAEEPLHQPVPRDSFQIFRNALAIGEERQRFPGARGFVENRAERLGFVQSGKQHPLRPEDLKSIHHASYIGGFHRGR